MKVWRISQWDLTRGDFDLVDIGMSKFGPYKWNAGGPKYTFHFIILGLGLVAGCMYYPIQYRDNVG